MTEFVSIGVILLAALVHATLQLGLGALLLLYHASLGKHIRVRTRRLVNNYLLGSGLMTMLTVATCCFFIAVLAGGSLSAPALLVAVVILFVLAIFAWFFYYRRGRSTELWLPKTVARYINQRAKITESNTEAFALGLLASFAEMPFSLILMVVAGNGILMLPQCWQIWGVVGYTLVALAPLLILKLSIRSGKTVADVQRWRVKNKNFFRWLTGVGFMVLALFLVAFGVLGGGRLGGWTPWEGGL